MKDPDNFLDALARIAIATLLGVMLCGLLTAIAGCRSVRETERLNVERVGETKEAEVGKVENNSVSHTTVTVNTIDSSRTIETYYDTLGRPILQRDTRNWHNQKENTTKKDTVATTATVETKREGRVGETIAQDKKRESESQGGFFKRVGIAACIAIGLLTVAALFSVRRKFANKGSA